MSCLHLPTLILDPRGLLDSGEFSWGLSDGYVRVVVRVSGKYRNVRMSSVPLCPVEAERQTTSFTSIAKS